MNTTPSSQSGLRKRTEPASAPSCDIKKSSVAESTIAAQSDPNLVKPFRFPPTPHEYKVTALRECPVPESMLLCDTPEKAAEYWRMHIATHPYFSPECECLAVLLLNARRRIRGHHLVTIGTQDTLLVHAREIFRIAVLTSANAILLMHNHPSGEAQPSEADVRVTRDLIRAGQLLKIEVLDHVIVGAPGHVSLRGLGYFSL